MKRTISEDEVVPAAAGETGPGVPEAARRPLRDLMDDRLLDALLERSRDQAGGLRLTGEGSMLGELVRAVLERALESELTAHLGYEKGGRGGARAFCRAFFTYYNHEHRHSGIGLHTPYSVHIGTAPAIQEKRQAVLNAACAANPQRFTRRPKAPKMPGAAWINKPVTEPDIARHPSLEAA